MTDNILSLSKILNSGCANEIIAEIIKLQKDTVDKTGKAARIAFSEASNKLLPIILNGCGIYICIFSNDCSEIPEDFCYISSGAERVLAKKLKKDETVENVCAEISKFWETLPDFPVFAAESLADCGFCETEPPAHLVISDKNIKLGYYGSCIDGSGDTVLRVFEQSDENAAEETRAFISSDTLDCGFWFDIRKNDVKTFRIGKSTVRETNFCQGIIPFDEMLE